MCLLDSYSGFAELTAFFGPDFLYFCSFITCFLIFKFFYYVLHFLNVSVSRGQPINCLYRYNMSPQTLFEGFLKNI